MKAVHIKEEPLSNSVSVVLAAIRRGQQLCEMKQPDKDNPAVENMLKILERTKKKVLDKS